MPSENKVFVFVNGGDSGSFDVVALHDSGKLYRQKTFRSVILAKEEVAKSWKWRGREKVVWVDSPLDHPGVVKACELWQEAIEAEQEQAEADAGAIPEEAVRALKDGHACNDCVHASVCGTSAAITQHEARGGIVVITACYDRVKIPKE